jgi:hypothetical protein
MEDFFKQFRQNWQQRPEPTFEPADWQSLQNRLDRERRRRPAAFGWWWLALPLLLALSISNLLLFRELRLANQKIITLENRRDTAFVERVVYRTDTIFQTRLLRETVVEYLPNRFVSGSIGAGKAPEAVADFSLPTSSMAMQPGIVNGAAPFDFMPENPAATANTPGLSSEETEPLPPVFLLEKIPLPAFPLLELPRPDLPGIAAAPFVFEKKKTLRQRLYPLRPKDFSLLANGGWQQPLGEGVEKGTGYLFGLEGGVGFSPRLALWLEATHGKMTIEADRMDGSLGIPAIPPPADDFVFSSAETAQRAWLLAAGLQYALLNRSSWRLWAGAGYGAVRVQPYRVVYDFANAAGLEWSVTGETQRPGWLNDQWLLRLAVERRLTRHLDWHFGAMWRSSTGSPALGLADGLGLRTGVRFGF